MPREVVCAKPISIQISGISWRFLGFCPSKFEPEVLIVIFNPLFVTMKKLLFALTTVICLSGMVSAEDAKGILGILPSKLKDSKGKTVSTSEALNGKIVGLYFSAHWCPPCRAFTPSLVTFRDENEKEFEIVFVSSDNSEKEKKEYIRSENMKWLNLDGVRSDDGKALMDKYSVSGIPKLVILAPDGSTITENGRGDVSGDPKGALAKWKAAVKP